MTRDKFRATSGVVMSKWNIRLFDSIFREGVTSVTSILGPSTRFNIVTENIYETRQAFAVRVFGFFGQKAEHLRSLLKRTKNEEQRKRNTQLIQSKILKAFEKGSSAPFLSPLEYLQRQRFYLAAVISRRAVVSSAFHIQIASRLWKQKLFARLKHPSIWIQLSK